VILTTFAGILADRFGRLRVLLPGLFVFAVAGAACVFATSLPVLIGLRVVQGIGASTIGSINVTLIGDLFAGRQRTAAMGFNASVLSIGTAAYPAVGGALAMIAWSAPFALALLAIPVAILAARRLHEAPQGHKANLGDYFGDVWKIVMRREVLALFFASTSIFILLYGAYVTFLPFLMAGRFGASPLGIGLLMVAILYSVILLLAYDWIVSVVLGDKYTDLFTITMMWCLYTCLLALRNGAEIAMQVLNKFKKLSAASFFSAFVSLIATYWLVMFHGTTGALIGISMGELAMITLIYLNLKRVRTSI